MTLKPRIEQQNGSLVATKTPRFGGVSTTRPIDLVHLSRQSLGDRSLEEEILRMFKSQTALYLSRLENATTADERRLAAHTILGSARGIGAWHVAAAAQHVEELCQKGCDLAGLHKVVGDANAYIGELLDA